MIAGTPVKATVTLTLKPDAGDKHLPVDFALNREGISTGTLSAAEA